MIALHDLALWLADQGITTPIYENDWQTTPDRLVLLRQAPGGPPLYERTHDQAAILVWCRGDQADHASAEALAQDVDAALMGASYPFTIGARRVISVDYVSGPPAALAQDDARRSVFYCVYRLIVDRPADAR